MEVAVVISYILYSLDKKGSGEKLGSSSINFQIKLKDISALW
jgi:hypothetical protein